MPPKQATLGKFFGGHNGTKAVSRQSTLAFSSKSAKKDEKENEEIVGLGDVEQKSHEQKTHKADADGDTSVVDPALAASTPEADKAESDSDGGSNSKRKRISNEEPEPDVEEHGADGAEPPKKKQRGVETSKTKIHLKSASSTTPTESTKNELEQVARTKSHTKKQDLEEEEDDSDEEPVRPVKRTESKAKSTKVAERNGVNKGTKAEKPSRSKGDKSADQSDTAQKSINAQAAAARTSAKEDEAEVLNDRSRSEPEEEASSEDEKPEIVAKARAKVQSSLGGDETHPYLDWKAGDPVPYAALCTTFSLIEMTTKRLEILAHCAKFFRQVLRLTPRDLEPTVLLMINKLAADYTGIELGIGESLIMKAIGESTGRSLAIIKADQKEIGDLGLVAAKSRSNQPTMFKPKPLTVRGVQEALMVIAQTEGKGAQERKVGGIKKLLSAADPHLAGKGSKGVDITKDKGGPSESKFIVRTLEGKLRLGLADKTVLVALSQAVVIHEIRSKTKKVPSTQQLADGERILKSVYSELPSYEVIIPPMLEHGIMNLAEHCKLRPGVPLKPMLAKPTKSITEVLDRFEGKSFSCEYKYDGERAQIHFVANDADESFATATPKEGKTSAGVSNIFSRNSEDLSKKYPDILERLPKWVKADTKSFVLDCETVAWDVAEKKVLPFQQLMTRKRKDVKAEEITVQVCVFAFDLLYLNGEALVNKTFRERRELLRNSFQELEGEFCFAQYGDTDQLDEIQVLLEDSVKASCEGLMVKMLDGPESSYEPSKRSQNWLKVKKDYLSGVGDSLDLVVLGAYFGRGKRTSWYGAFLLACYNPSSQNYETVCNIGTGFSEAILDEFHTKLSEHTIERAKPFYSHSVGNKDQPDVWFEPKFVWEVKTADLTLSPRYKAAAQVLSGSGGKGISLRFPRFIKERDDKKPDQATTSRQIAEMYQKQESVGKNKGPSADDDFEY